MELIAEDVYYIEKSINGFRPNVPGRIIGFKMVTPGYGKLDGLKPRLCYEVRYEDGKVDYKAIEGEFTHEN